MSMRKLRLVALALPLLVLSAGCARKAVHREEPPLETFQTHYLQGQQYLAQGNFQGAVDQFRRAHALNPDYVPVYEGLGLAQLGLGHLGRARGYFQEGLQRDSTYAPFHTGLGRILSAQGDDQGAIGQFQRALELDPGNADAFYYQGESYVNLGKYSRAEESYKKALDNNPSHAQASEAWARLVRMRTSPGEPPPQYVAIVKKPVVNRADFAALLAHQLPLEDICEPRGAEVSPPDIGESWARAEIGKVVACELMSLYPSGEFKPHRPMTRLGCALVIREILLRTTSEPQLLKPFIGQSSPYPDVPVDHEAFEAIMLATNREIMKAKADGSFHPEDAVNGHVATKIVHALKNQL